MSDFRKWPPRIGEHVIDLDRQDMGVTDWGKVNAVNWHDRSVRVRFFGGNVEYNGTPTVRIGGILHHYTYLMEHPELAFGGGDRCNYDFDQFEGCWSSHDTDVTGGGDGAWLIGGTNADDVEET
jgi:hypothetical protein